MGRFAAAATNASAMSAILDRHAAQPRAKECAGLVREQGQAVQRSQVARAEQLAYQSRRWRHGCQPGEAKSGGKEVERDRRRWCQQVDHDHHRATCVPHREDHLHVIALAQRAGHQYCRHRPLRNRRVSRMPRHDPAAGRSPAARTYASALPGWSGCCRPGKPPSCWSRCGPSGRQGGH